MHEEHHGQVGRGREVRAGGVPVKEAVRDDGDGKNQEVVNVDGRRMSIGGKWCCMICVIMPNFAVLLPYVVGGHNLE